MKKYYFFIVLTFAVFTNHILNAQTLSFTDVAVQLGIHYGEHHSGSVCWGDYDNDGDIDLYIVSSGYSLTGPQNLNYLYRNDFNTTGRFNEVAASFGVDEAISNSYSATWCDVNNDGLLDLYVCNLSDYISPHENTLFINNGNTFDDQTILYNVSNFGNNNACCWGDYDNDGDQDLFLAVGHVAGLSESKLYRNDGDQFTDVTSIYNITTDTQNSMNASWVDFDNDGDLDLYIYLSVLENRLYENRIDKNNTFVNIAADYGLNDIGLLGGSLWFDFDNDDDLDICITNYISPAYPQNHPPTRLFRNDLNIDNKFTDVTTLIGLPDSLSSWSGTVSDFDLDGDLDLYLTDYYKKNHFFRNDVNNSGIFIEEGTLLNIADSLAGKATVSGDYDNDGDMDIFVLNSGNDEFNRMYRNEINSDNYLIIRLTDKNGSFNRFGSRAKVYFAGTDSLAGMRVVDGGGSGGRTQDQYDCHFGLNPNLAYDIEVVFTTRTNGKNHIFNKHNRPELGEYIPSQHGQFLEVRDSVVTVTSIIPKNKPKLIKSFKLYQNYPNPFNSTTIISFDLPKFSEVEIVIYDALGKKVRTLTKANMKAGTHQSTWDGKDRFSNNVSSGVYFYTFTANALDGSKEIFVKSSKLLLLR